MGQSFNLSGMFFPPRSPLTCLRRAAQPRSCLHSWIRTDGGTGFPIQHLGHLDVYQRQFAAVDRETSGLRRPGAAELDLA